MLGNASPRQSDLGLRYHLLERRSQHSDSESLEGGAAEEPVAVKRRMSKDQDVMIHRDFLLVVMTYGMKYQ